MTTGGLPVLNLESSPPLEGHGSVSVRRLSDVAPERVRWLWRNRIPLGKITVLDGDPGLGKSLITLDIAARVSRGADMPDDTRSDVGEATGVVLIGAEDDLADTVRPRLDAAKADVARVGFVEGVRDANRAALRLPNLSDLAAMEEAITQYGARLVVIDPVMAFLGTGTDAHRDSDIRSLLMPLAQLAARLGAAILIVRHLNKGVAQNALYRGGGSIGIIGAARSGLLVAADPDDPLRRILAPTKNNLAREAPALAYVVVAGDTPSIRWLGQTEHRASELLSTPRTKSGARADAAEFLQSELSDGPQPARKVQASAQEAGISRATLRRAANDLVRKKKRGQPGEAAWWEWELREHAQRSPKVLKEKREHLRSDVSTFDGNGAPTWDE